MANEISYTVSGSLTNGGLKRTLTPGQVQIDQATKGAFSSAQVVGTSAELVTFADVSNPRLIFIQNLDAANFVTFGPCVGGSSTGALTVAIKLFAGDTAIFPGSTAAVYKAQADTAPVRMLIDVWEA